jgi:hypothetical protein
MAGRAKHVVLNDKKLRRLRKSPTGGLVYDKILPDLIVRCPPTGALTWGMIQGAPPGNGGPC